MNKCDDEEKARLKRARAAKNKNNRGGSSHSSRRTYS